MAGERGREGEGGGRERINARAQKDTDADRDTIRPKHMRFGLTKSQTWKDGMTDTVEQTDTAKILVK